MRRVGTEDQMRQVPGSVRQRKDREQGTMATIKEIAVIMYLLKVEKADADWDAAHGAR
ncbi:MAG: hypothetical protein HFI35_07155 [Roseburia sp.]|nr:hypothetical protein [Roseburia sp.]